MLQLNICTYISVKGLETPVVEVFRRLINQTGFSLQEQNFNRFIHSLTTHCMLMVCSFTLIIITTTYSLLTQNCYSLAVMSDASSEHTVFRSWYCGGNNDCQGPWWPWAATVRVSRLESPLVREIREETSVFSILPQLLLVFQPSYSPFPHQTLLILPLIFPFFLLGYLAGCPAHWQSLLLILFFILQLFRYLLPSATPNHRGPFGGHNALIFT